MLTESTTVSAITILEDGQLQVRRSRRVFDTATTIAEQYHRHVATPGDTLSADVKAHLQKLFRITATSVDWTPETIAAWKAAHPTR